LELAVLLELPQPFRTVNRLNLPAEDALAIALRRLAYPTRMGDLELFFGRSKSSLSRIFNAVIYHIYDRFNHLLRWDRNRLTVDVLDRFCMAVNAKGVPLNNCFGFIDGTIRQISRPKMNQRLFFNGHRRKHSVKYQSVTTPDGLISPFWSRRRPLA
jgi:hypothetical protein